MKIKSHPVNMTLYDSIELVSSAGGILASSHSQLISAHADFASVQELYDEFRLNKVKVHILPLQGKDVSGIFMATGEHISDNSIPSVPSDIAAHLEQVDRSSPSMIKPANQKITINIAIKDKKEYYSLADESTKTKSKCSVTYTGDRLPVSTAMFLLIWEWNITLK